MGQPYMDEKQISLYVWITTVICTFITILRGVVRWRQYGRFYQDDWWSFLGLAFLWGTAVHAVLVVPELFEQQRRLDGKPPHMSDKEYQSHTVLLAKLMISILQLFWGVLWSVKMSFLMLIKRMLAPNKRYVIWWWITLGWTIAMYLAAFLSNMLECLPIWRRWSTDPTKYCGTSGANAPAVAFAISLAFDASSDLAIMVLPLYMIRKLKVTRARRLAVQAMFCLSTPLIIIAVLRVGVVVAIGGSEGGLNMHHWMAWTWSEPWVAMIIVHIPTFKPIFDLFTHKASATPIGRSLTATLKQRKRSRGLYSTGGLYETNNSNQGLNLETQITHHEPSDPAGKIGYSTDFAVTYDREPILTPPEASSMDSRATQHHTIIHAS